MEKKFDKLLKDNFDIHFNNEDLLDEAFTQASYVNEHPEHNLKFYERLEFLGDSVYQIVISDYIFKRFPNMPQGRLTRLRAAMVNEHSFSKLARECSFDKYIRLGKGEEKANARNRDSLLCDIFESFIGAVYLDQGMPKVIEFCRKVIFPKIDEGDFDELFDHKTVLQEVAQENGPAHIKYEVIGESGDENNRKFKVEVKINEQVLGQGEASSKKDAEQQAAKEAINKISDSSKVKK